MEGVDWYENTLPGRESEERRVRMEPLEEKLYRLGVGYEIGGPVTPLRRGRVALMTLGGDDFSLVGERVRVLLNGAIEDVLVLDPTPLRGEGMTISTSRSFRMGISARETGRSSSSSIWGKLDDGRARR